MNEHQKLRVLLGMSGGIDSTVSAMLLLEQGYEVVGCTFRTFDSIKDSCLAREKGCCDVESIMEAKANCQRLGMEHHIVDFRDTFREKVMGNFISEYCSGRTPNPCVLCNCHIKWGEMLRLADEWRCDYVATGHYARIARRTSASEDGVEHLCLQAAVDEKKDQTYFLWMLTEQQLARTLFPLGDYTKEQVREMARVRGFEKLAVKRESQDICFVPDGDYRSFLQSVGAESKSGCISCEGRVLRQHEGIHSFTIGQRKGLGVAVGYPAFVTNIDPDTGAVLLGRREDLYRREVRLSQAFFRGDPTQPVMAKVRYRSEATEAQISLLPSALEPQSLSSSAPDSVLLRFVEPVWAPTPGQSCVLYQDDLLVGAGVIER